MKGFIEFIKEKGVAGFAVGFIMGGAVSQLVTSFVNDIINPLVGIALSRTKSLDSMSFQIAGAKIAWGHFLSSTLNFLIIAYVVYLIFKGLSLEKTDKKNK